MFITVGQLRTIIRGRLEEFVANKRKTGGGARANWRPQGDWFGMNMGGGGGGFYGGMGWGDGYGGWWPDWAESWGRDASDDAAEFADMPGFMAPGSPDAAANASMGVHGYSFDAGMDGGDGGDGGE